MWYGSEQNNVFTIALKFSCSYNLKIKQMNTTMKKCQKSYFVHHDCLQTLVLLFLEIIIIELEKLELELVFSAILSGAMRAIRLL